MRKQVFLMTYRKIHAKHITCSTLFLVFFCMIPVHAYDVFNSFDDTDTLSIREQFLKLIDPEVTEILRLKDVNINEDVPHVSVPLSYKLIVTLSGRNWILDARKSDITQSDKSNIILQGLQESQETSMFVFARNAEGTNKLVFSRSDNATADEFSYLLSVTWVDTAGDASGDEPTASTLSDASVLVRDSRAIVMIVPHDSLDTNIAHLFSSDTSQKILSTLRENTHTTFPKSHNVVPTSTTQSNKENLARTENTPKEVEVTLENNPPHTKTTTSNDAYELSLQEINKLLKSGSYEEAQNAIGKYKNNMSLQKAVPHLLFDSAQYLEKMHERENIQNIQNIEKAITFYDLIVDEYPLSVVYDEALARREFLQKKYVFIR